MKKANNMDMGDIEQQITLFKTKLFKNLPIHQLFINNLEADDVIANLTRIHNEDNIIIISADADFYQLLSDNVIIYNHLKKNYVTLKDISKEIANPFNFI
jgi:5'-3' exonuclease